MLTEPKPVPALADCKDSVSQAFFVFKQCLEGARSLNKAAEKFAEASTELVINLPPGALSSPEEED